VESIWCLSEACTLVLVLKKIKKTTWLFLWVFALRAPPHSLTDASVIKKKLLANGVNCAVIKQKSDFYIKQLL